MTSYAARRAGAVIALAVVHLLTGADARAEERAQHITAESEYQITGRVGGKYVTLPLADVIVVKGRMVEERRSDARVILRDGRTLELTNASIRVPRGWSDPDRRIDREEDGSVTFFCAMRSLDELFRFVASGDQSARLRNVSHQELVDVAIGRASRAVDAYLTTKGDAERAEAQAAAGHLRSLLGGQASPTRASQVLDALDAIAQAHGRAPSRRRNPARASKVARPPDGNPGATAEGKAGATAKRPDRGQAPGGLAAARTALADALRAAAAGQGPLAADAIARDPAAARVELDRLTSAHRQAGGRTAHLAKLDPVLRRLFGSVSRDLRRAESRPTLPRVPTELAPLVARDVTELALKGKLDPVVGRKAEIRGLARGLGGRSKRNVILVGEPGVGKTALVDGLAQEIVKGDVPPAIRGKRILEISMSQLTAGTRYRGEFEERLQRMLASLAAIKEAERPILFIDEGHTIIGAGSTEGSAMDASNILKPALARGELQVITATTLDEYRKHVKKDRALERRFKPLFVAEPVPETALAIIRAKRSLNQNHFKVTIGKSAMRAAVDLSVRFLPERRLPDKAQDVLEEAASRIAARGGKIVTRRDVEEVIQEWSGVPIRTGRQEARHLLELEKKLGGRVFGQGEAVGLTARAVRRARAKMLRGGAKRPASLLFLGPTGVGKSELGKALAQELFGDESAALTFDMSEYAEKHTASLLIGSPNGYVNSEDGGRLTNAVRARPFQVIVLDEIEKAHPEVVNLLLQVLEEGRLSDRWGPVNFKNTIIIMTSNAILEAPKAKKAIGFATGVRDEPSADPGDAALRRTLIGLGWRPELVNRVDGAALFNKLDARSLDAIVDKTLREVGRAYGISVRASRAAKDELLRRGTDPDLGARPIRRAAQAVEDVVAGSVLSGSRERELEVDYSGGRFLAKQAGAGEKTKKATRVNPQLRKRLETRKATRAAGPGRGR